MPSNPVVDLFGTKRWYKNDKLHRDDGPAVECLNGTRAWYKDGNLHRENGPACESFKDDKTLYYKYWYKNGKRHRDDGPAVEYADGDKFWYKDGVRIDPPKEDRKVFYIGAANVEALIEQMKNQFNNKSDKRSKFMPFLLVASLIFGIAMPATFYAGEKYGKQQAENRWKALQQYETIRKTYNEHDINSVMQLLDAREKAK